MFPGFVTSYKDNYKKIHLYFFPGIDKDGNIIYKDLDISNTNLGYIENINDDGSKEFIFNKKNIIKIHCKLVRNDGGIDYVDLIM